MEKGRKEPRSVHVVGLEPELAEQYARFSKIAGNKTNAVRVWLRQMTLEEFAELVRRDLEQRCRSVA